MIQIDYRDSRPIYEQIREGLRRMITTGAIRPDEKIPSVRELAAALAINPNTIQRAYRELEQEGYLYKVTGRGTFAAEIDPKESPRFRELMEQFEATAKELYLMGVSAEELTRRLETMEGEKESRQYEKEKDPVQQTAETTEASGTKKEGGIRA